MAVKIGSQYRYVSYNTAAWAPQHGDIFTVVREDSEDGWWMKCLNPNWKGIHENGGWYSSLGSEWELIPYSIPNQIKCPNCNCNLSVSLVAGN